VADGVPFTWFHRGSAPCPAEGRCVLIRSMKLRTGLSPALGLLLLSMLWASGWLLTDLFPSFGANSFSLPLRQAVVFSAFAAMTASIAVVQRHEFPSGRRAWASAGIGLGFFVIPTSAAAFAQGWISNLDEVAVLCLTPVFAVVLEPWLDDHPPRRGRAALAGALVAVAGILCLFPLEIPSSFRAGVELLVLLVTAFALAAPNCIAVRVARGVPGRDLAARAAFTAYLQLYDTGTRPCVLGSTQTHRRLFDSELSRRLTDTTSLDVAALIGGKPMSLYIIVPPFRLTAYRPLLRLWLPGLILAAAHRSAAPKDRTRCCVTRSAISAALMRS
jgi:hypothetical protein